jgi:hypothetical protein
MRIQIVKKAGVRVRPMEPCPYVVECPPEASKKQD